MKHSPYSQFNAQKMNYRDFLAMDRTTLANERTLLAYGRTSLMLMVTGLTLIKLFADSHEMIVLGWILIPLGAVVAVVGTFRYMKIRRAIYTALDRLIAGSLSPAPRDPVNASSTDD